MRSILYIIIIMLLIGWALGVFAYNAAAGIHFLLLIALFILVIDLVRVRKGR